MKFFVCIGKWKDNGPPLNQSCEALQLNITRSVIFQLYIFSESTSIHDIASAGFESATFWLQATYMLDIQRNCQSKLSNVPLSINVFWVYIILIILFKKNFTTKNGIWLNLSAIYLHCTLCEESCTGTLDISTSRPGLVLFQHVFTFFVSVFPPFALFIFAVVFFFFYIFIFD